MRLYLECWWVLSISYHNINPGPLVSLHYPHQSWNISLICNPERHSWKYFEELKKCQTPMKDSPNQQTLSNSMLPDIISVKHCKEYRAHITCSYNNPRSFCEPQGWVMKCQGICPYQEGIFSLHPHLFQELLLVIFVICFYQYIFLENIKKCRIVIPGKDVNVVIFWPMLRPLLTVVHVTYSTVSFSDWCLWQSLNFLQIKTYCPPNRYHDHPSIQNIHVWDP